MILFEVALIILITMGFSIAVLFSKVSLNHIRPERFAMLYIMGASLVIFIEFSVFHLLGKAPIIIGVNIWIILVAAFFGAFAYFFGYVGLKNTNAGISSTIFNLQGPLIALLGALFYMEYPGNLVLTGLAIAIVGLFMMGSSGNSGKEIKFNIPFILLSLSPLFWALEWVIFSFVSYTAPIFFTFVLYFSIFLVLVAMNFISKPPLISSPRIRAYALTGGLFSGIANGAYGIFITYYGTTLTGLITLISVPVSIILVVVILKERYMKLEMLGIILVCIGLLVSAIL